MKSFFFVSSFFFFFFLQVLFFLNERKKSTGKKSQRFSLLLLSLASRLLLSPQKLLLEVEHQIHLLDVQVRAPFPERNPAVAAVVSIPSSSPDSQLRLGRGKPRAAPDLQPQPFRDPEPVPEREGVTRPDRAAASELVSESQRGAQRLHRERRRPRPREAPSSSVTDSGVPAAPQRQQPVVADPGEDPHVRPRGTRRAASKG